MISEPIHSPLSIGEGARMLAISAPIMTPRRAFAAGAMRLHLGPSETGEIERALRRLVRFQRPWPKPILDPARIKLWPLLLGRPSMMPCSSAFRGKAALVGWSSALVFHGSARWTSAFFHKNAREPTRGEALGWTAFCGSLLRLFGAGSPASARPGHASSSRHTFGRGAVGRQHFSAAPRVRAVSRRGVAAQWLWPGVLGAVRAPRDTDPGAIPPDVLSSTFSPTGMGGLPREKSSALAFNLGQEAMARLRAKRASSCAGCAGSADSRDLR